MIFPTLEGLTAKEQEALEAEQRSGRNCYDDTEWLRTARVRGSLIPATLAYMKPGREYAAGHLIAASGIVYSHLQHMVKRGQLSRTGERGHYRYTKVIAPVALNALEPA